MKIAVVADLHGNRPATQALEADLTRRGITRIWCLGDMVGKGPSSDWTFDWALRNCEVIIQGNWDEGIGSKLFANDSYYYRQLGPQRMEKLMSFPLEKHVSLAGRKIRLLHGRPILDGVLYIHDDYKFLQALLEPDFDVAGYADCHRQGLRIVKGIVFNCGSVGNSMGVPMVQYAQLDTPLDEPGDALDITLVTLPYDRAAAADDARAAVGLPNAQAYIQEVETGVYARPPGMRSQLRP